MSSADSDSGDITPEQTLAVDQFCAFTGSSPEAAKQALEACNWNLEMAVNMQMDYGEPAVTVPPLISSSSSGSQPSTSSMRTGEDNIRAPIPPKRQVLVDDFADMDVPIYPHRTRSSQIHMFNNTMRDFQREARYREEMAAAAASASGSSQVENVESDATKRQTLEDLFRPPLDLMFQGSFENAKDKGVRDNRWIMINVQDETEFTCQVLNRDVWSNSAVRSIIEEHFVFWQVSKNSREGNRYMQFYPVTTFPYVAILDPRTGENLKCWHVIQDSNMFCELVTDFLQDHPTPSGDPIPDSVPLPLPAAQPAAILNHHNMSEEEQLKAAIAASLQEPIRICDDDEDEIETFSSDDEKDSDSPVELKQNHVNESESLDVDLKIKDTETSAPVVIEDHTDYLGTDTAETSLVLRLPDGNREVVTVPCDTKLKYVLLLVQSKGFSLNQYDIMAFHPRRLVHEMSPDASLSDLKLLKEQLFIQLKQ